MSARQRTEIVNLQAKIYEKALKELMSLTPVLSERQNTKESDDEETENEIDLAQHNSVPKANKKRLSSSELPEICQTFSRLGNCIFFR